MYIYIIYIYIYPPQNPYPLSVVNDGCCYFYDFLALLPLSLWCCNRSCPCLWGSLIMNTWSNKCLLMTRLWVLFSKTWSTKDLNKRPKWCDVFQAHVMATAGPHSSTPCTHQTKPLRFAPCWYKSPSPWEVAQLDLGETPDSEGNMQLRSQW